MGEKMFTVSIDKEFDVASKETTTSIYLRVYTSLFQNGIVKDLKPKNFTVLLAIASYMDAEGNCYPTQRQIADITGLSTPTVNKSISELLEFKVNGNPIITREFVQQGQFKNSYYTVNPISQIAIFDGQVKRIETDSVKKHEQNTLKDFTLNNNQETISNDTRINTNTNTNMFKNAKDVAVYFADKYREKYGVNYNIMFQRELPMIKKKLIGTFTDKQIQTMIDATIEYYDSKWKNLQYPRPTIGSMISWIGQKALAIAEDSKKEYEELQEMTSDSDDKNAEVLKKFGL